MDPLARLRLEDMLEHARFGVQILGELGVEQLAQNNEKQLALSRAIEIVGEAANTVQKDVRENLPTLPWRQMIGMRHRLVHGYATIDLKRIVDPVRNDLPPLIAELERILAKGAEG